MPKLENAARNMGTPKSGLVGKSSEEPQQSWSWRASLLTNTLKIQTQFYLGAHFLSPLLNFPPSLHNFFSVLSFLLALGNLSSGFTLCAYRRVVLSPRLVLFTCSLFFYVMVTLVQPQEGRGRGLGSLSVLYSQVLSTGSPHALLVTGEAPDFGQVSEDQREGKARAKAHHGISAGKAKLDKVNGLELVNLDVSLSFGLQDGPWLLGIWPWMIKQNNTASWGTQAR